VVGSFFVDENDLALGKRLAELHAGVVYPGHPDVPELPRGALDDEWLPIVGANRLVVITRDLAFATDRPNAWRGSVTACGGSS